MTTRCIKVEDLPTLDAALRLDSEDAIVAYLTDILEAKDSGLLAVALDDIARARGLINAATATE